MANFMSFNPKSYEAACTRVQKLNFVMQEYCWVIDAYVSDFYTRDHWLKLPKSLRDYFDAVEPPELAWMLAVDGDRKQQLSVSVIPLSLLALHCCIQNLSLRRVAVDIDSVETKSSISLSLCMKGGNIPKDVDPQATVSNLVETEANQKPNYKNGQCMDMLHIFRKHVKPKKQHEIDKLGQVIRLLSQLTACSSVVDVGAGLGHLSRLLTFQHGFHVTSIEADDGHAPVAAEYDRQMRKDVHKVIEKRKVLSSDTRSSVESSKYQDMLTVHKKCPLQNEIMCCHSSVNRECHRMDSSDHCDTFCNGKSSLCSRSTDSSFFSRSCCESGSKHNSHRHSHPLAVARGSENHCHVSSDGDRAPVCVVSHGEESLPNHVVHRVQPDIASSQFLDILKLNSHGGEVKEDEKPSDFILAGLHACGDLTPTLLRVFVNCKAAIGLASVACCYMKMTASACLTPESAILDNYPMSQFLRCLPCSQLGYEARELACHFADAYFARLKDNSPHLMIHSFRAALQYLITAVNPQFEIGRVKFVSRKQDQGSFLQYVTENLKKIGTDISTIPQDLIDYCESLTKHWKRVVAFYTLRLSLAPAVETLILLDRALFLLENGFHCAVVPIFDPVISPRNFALLAVKR